MSKLILKYLILMRNPVMIYQVMVLHHQMQMILLSLLTFIMLPHFVVYQVKKYHVILLQHKVELIWLILNYMILILSYLLNINSILLSLLKIH
jgi:hypothetical protein